MISVFKICFPTPHFPDSFRPSPFDSLLFFRPSPRSEPLLCSSFFRQCFLYAFKFTHFVLHLILELLHRPLHRPQDFRFKGFFIDPDNITPSPSEACHSKRPRSFCSVSNSLGVSRLTLSTTQHCAFATRETIHPSKSSSSSPSGTDFVGLTWSNILVISTSAKTLLFPCPRGSQNICLLESRSPLSPWCIVSRDSPFFQYSYPHGSPGQSPIGLKCMGSTRNSKMKVKQNWTSEKPKLENARRLRGIYSIEPGGDHQKCTKKN